MLEGGKGRQREGEGKQLESKATALVEVNGTVPGDALALTAFRAFSARLIRLMKAARIRFTMRSLFDFKHGYPLSYYLQGPSHRK